MTRRSTVARRVFGGGRVPRDEWYGLLAQRPPNFIELMRALGEFRFPQRVQYRCFAGNFLILRNLSDEKIETPVIRSGRIL